MSSWLLAARAGEIFCTDPQSRRREGLPLRSALFAPLGVQLTGALRGHRSDGPPSHISVRLLAGVRYSRRRNKRSGDLVLKKAVSAGIQTESLQADRTTMDRIRGPCADCLRTGFASFG